MVQRKLRHSVTASLAGAAIEGGFLFVVFLMIGLGIVGAAINVLQAGGIIRWGPIEPLVYIAVAGAALLLAGAAFREMYAGLRWDAPARDCGYCLKCDYNLTGNISGVCPECGTAIPESGR